MDAGGWDKNRKEGKERRTEREGMTMLTSTREAELDRGERDFLLQLFS